MCPWVTGSLPEPEPCCWGAAEPETARRAGGRAPGWGGAGWGLGAGKVRAGADPGELSDPRTLSPQKA